MGSNLPANQISNVQHVCPMSDALFGVCSVRILPLYLRIFLVFPFSIFYLFLFALFERFVLSLCIVDEIKAELFAVLSEKMRPPISVRRSKKDK